MKMRDIYMISGIFSRIIYIVKSAKSVLKRDSRASRGGKHNV